jgi:hypothetical protein
MTSKMTNAGSFASPHCFTSIAKRDETVKIASRRSAASRSSAGDRWARVFPPSFARRCDVTLREPSVGVRDVQVAKGLAEAAFGLP